MMTDYFPKRKTYEGRPAGPFGKRMSLYYVRGGYRPNYKFKPMQAGFPGNTRIVVPGKFIKPPRWFKDKTNELNAHIYYATEGKQVTNAEKAQAVLVVGNIGETEKLQTILIANHTEISGDSNLEKQKFLLGSWTKKTTMVNSSNMACTVKCFKMKPRRDIPLSYVNSTSDGYTTTETMDALVKVLFDDNNAGTWYENYGVKPTDSQELMSKFKILQKKTYTILPGDSVQLSTKVLYKQMQGDNFTKDGVFAFKKLTTFWLIILQGQIAHDATTETEVGTAGGRLDILEETRCSTYLPDAVQGSISYTAGMGTLAAGAEQYVVNNPTESADAQ